MSSATRLLPTIAVVATQVGYLLGGLVAIELLFNYRGIGLTTLEAAQLKDYTVARRGRADHRVHVYVVVTLDRGHPLRAAEPTHPLRGSPSELGRSVSTGRSEASVARRERTRLLLTSPTFIVGAAVILFWVVVRSPR